MQVAAVRYGHCTKALQPVARPFSAIPSRRTISQRPLNASPWMEGEETRALAAAKARIQPPKARVMLSRPFPNLVSKNPAATQQKITGEPKIVPPLATTGTPPSELLTPPTITSPPETESPLTQRLASSRTFTPPVSRPQHGLSPRHQAFARQMVFSNVTSRILRHTARNLGYQIVPDGFVRVSDVMRDEFYRDYDFKMFSDLCYSDPQDTFEMAFLPDFIEGQLIDVWWVRARYEHTIPYVDRTSHRVLNMGKLQVVIYLCRIDEWDDILQNGIREGPGQCVRMYRSLAGNLYKQDMKIPPRTKLVCVTIDAEKAAQRGVMFFNTNDYKLFVTGNRDKIIPPETFRNAVVLEVTKTDLLKK